MPQGSPVKAQTRATAQIEGGRPVGAGPEGGARALAPEPLPPAELPLAARNRVTSLSNMYSMSPFRQPCGSGLRQQCCISISLRKQMGTHTR